MDLNIGLKHPILAKPPYPPYTPDPPYSSYGHRRSNGWSFLTSTNLRPCTVSEMCVISECLCDFGVGLLVHPQKRARGAISEENGPKLPKHSFVR